MKRSMRTFAMVGMAVLMIVVGAMPALAAPDNDDPENAEEITSLPFSTSLSTRTATTTDEEPKDCAMGKAVWYRVTTTLEQRMQAETAGSSFDTVLAVYSGSPDALDLVACNDDSMTLTSIVRWDVTPGSTYYIAAGGYKGASGELAIELESIPTELEMALLFDKVEWFSSISGNPVITGTLDCSVPAEGVQLEISVGQKGENVDGHTLVDDCDGPTRWLMTFGRGDFHGGLASLEGRAYYGEEQVESVDAATLIACTRFGTLENDNLAGTNRPDRICGLDGDDVLEGRAGDDLLRGGIGNDRLVGASDQDKLFGGHGDDTLLGGRGRDELNGNEKNDLLDGGPGGDMCSGDQGVNRKRNC
ncbi:MAG TPA: calcium-binding protein [Actinomycetota bacterium]|nr:calcium-binding protein [Actinomycetota bacterium]